MLLGKDPVGDVPQRASVRQVNLGQQGFIAGSFATAKKADFQIGVFQEQCFDHFGEGVCVAVRLSFDGANLGVPLSGFRVGFNTIESGPVDIKYQVIGRGEGRLPQKYHQKKKDAQPELHKFLEHNSQRAIDDRVVFVIDLHIGVSAVGSEGGTAVGVTSSH